MKLTLNILTITALVFWFVGLVFLDYDWGVHGLLLAAAITFVFKLLVVEMRKKKELKENIGSAKM